MGEIFYTSSQLCEKYKSHMTAISPRMKRFVPFDFCSYRAKWRGSHPLNIHMNLVEEEKTSDLEVSGVLLNVSVKKCEEVQLELKKGCLNIL